MPEDTPVATPAATPTATPAATPSATPAAPATPAASATPAATPGNPAAAAELKPDDGKGYWPNDWLQRVSKGDDKVAKQLGRYASPEALAEAHIALRRRMDSGEFKAALPKDAKPEEITAWRKDNGIPEKADGYDLKFDSGLVIGKEDMPFVESFREAAHAANFTPAQFKGALEWYYADQERQTEARATQDEEQRVSAVDALNQEWGANFRGNINRIEGVLAMFPESVRDQLKAARMPDGTGIFNNIDVLRGFAALALELNPAGIVVPGATGDMMKGVEERIGEIEKVMRENRTAYNKDEKIQAEYRTLLGQREKMKERKAA